MAAAVPGSLVAAVEVELLLYPTIQQPPAITQLLLVVAVVVIIIQDLCQVIWVGNVEEIQLRLDM